MQLDVPVNVYYRSKDDGKTTLKCGRFVSLRHRRLHIKRFIDWDWDTSTPVLARKVINIHSDDIQFVREDQETLRKCATSSCSRFAPMWIHTRTCPEHNIIWDAPTLSATWANMPINLQIPAYSMRSAGRAISNHFSTVINNTLTIDPSHMTYEEIKKALGVDDNGNPINP